MPALQGNEVRLAFSTEKSKQVYERTLGVLIEASSSSSRGPANFGKHPIFMERGRGSRIYDVDGNEYIDWMMAFGALPLGHAHPEIVEAITEAATTGAHFATATPVELEVAEMLQRLVPNAERVRFANTGTEAVMAAIRLARGVTGRPKLLKFEGHYHGWHDDLLVSSNLLAECAGTAQRSHQDSRQFRLEPHRARRHDCRALERSAGSAACH
jgi:glutamate-1-semialdehyde 2,1-aminomutase